MKIKANDCKVYDVPDNPKWNSGPPPELGWWPASLSMNVKLLRWFDGEKWSQPVYISANQFDAEQAADIKTTIGIENIKWSDRWWLKGGSA